MILSDIPDELLLRIFFYLEFWDLAHLSLVDSKINRIVQDPNLWKYQVKKYEKWWVLSGNSQDIAIGTDYKEFIKDKFSRSISFLNSDNYFQKSPSNPAKIYISIQCLSIDCNNCKCLMSSVHSFKTNLFGKPIKAILSNNKDDCNVVVLCIGLSPQFGLLRFPLSSHIPVIQNEWKLSVKTKLNSAVKYLPAGMNMESRVLEIFQSGFCHTLNKHDLSLSIHDGIMCDKCEMNPIKGKRYSCTSCDFDLCSKCYFQGIPHINKKFTVIYHPFQAIRNHQITLQTLLGKSYKALCTYNSNSDKELSYRKGDVVILLNNITKESRVTAQLNQSIGAIDLSNFEPTEESTKLIKSRKKRKF